jgi:hypothetical protein
MFIAASAGPIAKKIDDAILVFKAQVSEPTLYLDVD